jgi:hypothetical protein
MTLNYGTTFLEVPTNIEAGDPPLLRNIDFAAHESLFEGKYFEESILSKKTQELALTFSNLLKTLIVGSSPGDPITSGTVSTDMWSEDYEDLAGREELFKQALRLKKDLMLSPGRYEMRTFNPGTIFDPTNMKAESNDGIPIHNVSKKSASKVRFCLFPAVYLYRSEPMQNEGAGEDGIDMSSTVVSSQIFLQTGLANKYFQESSRVILAKAVVLLEDPVAG